ncbi:unnamed protein product [Amoebophrya sp. A120]|nr:unnamed protein product [Amoebophrya sp. A120]|eukprot:GSA120T00022968001.1
MAETRSPIAELLRHPESFQLAGPQPRDPDDFSNSQESLLAEREAYLATLLQSGCESLDATRRMEAANEETEKKIQEREKQSKQVYERLFNDGEKYRERRRVYTEIGIMAEHEEVRKSCTFQPKLMTRRASTSGGAHNRSTRGNGSARGGALSARGLPGATTGEAKNHRSLSRDPSADDAFARLYEEASVRKQRQEQRTWHYEKSERPLFQPQLRTGKNKRGDVSARGPNNNSSNPNDSSLSENQAQQREDRFARLHSDAARYKASKEKLAERHHALLSFRPDVAKSSRTGPQFAKWTPIWQRFGQANVEDELSYEDAQPAIAPNSEEVPILRGGQHRDEPALEAELKRGTARERQATTPTGEKGVVHDPVDSRQRVRAAAPRDYYEFSSARDFDEDEDVDKVKIANDSSEEEANVRLAVSSEEEPVVVYHGRRDRQEALPLRMDIDDEEEDATEVEPNNTSAGANTSGRGNVFPGKKLLLPGGSSSATSTAGAARDKAKSYVSVPTGSSSSSRMDQQHGGKWNKMSSSRRTTAEMNKTSKQQMKPRPEQADMKTREELDRARQEIQKRLKNKIDEYAAKGQKARKDKEPPPKFKRTQLPAYIQRAKQASKDNLGAATSKTSSDPVTDIGAVSARDEAETFIKQAELLRRRKQKTTRNFTSADGAGTVTGSTRPAGTPGNDGYVPATSAVSTMNNQNTQATSTPLREGTVEQQKTSKLSPVFPPPATEKKILASPMYVRARGGVSPRPMRQDNLNFEGDHSRAAALYEESSASASFSESGKQKVHHSSCSDSRSPPEARDNALYGGALPGAPARRSREGAGAKLLVWQPPPASANSGNRVSSSSARGQMKIESPGISLFPQSPLLSASPVAPFHPGGSTFGLQPPQLLNQPGLVTQPLISPLQPLPTSPLLPAGTTGSISGGR